MDEPAVAVLAKLMAPFWRVPGAPEEPCPAGADPLARRFVEASLRPSGLAMAVLDCAFPTAVMLSGGLGSCRATLIHLRRFFILPSPCSNEGHATA